MKLSVRSVKAIWTALTVCCRRTEIPPGPGLVSMTVKGEYLIMKNLIRVIGRHLLAVCEIYGENLCRQ